MINITEIIANNNITTHDELQHHLYNLDNGKSYYEYECYKRDMLVAMGMMNRVEIVKLEGKELYYENCKIV